MHSIKNTINKYGICESFTYIPGFFMQKKHFEYISRRIKTFDYTTFLLNNDQPHDVRNLYQGDYVSDCHRILSGELKLLSYSLEDKMANKDIKHRWEAERCHDILVLSLSNGKKEENNSLLSKDILDRIIKATDSKVFENTNAMEISISSINLILAILNCHNIVDVCEKTIAKTLQKRVCYILEHIENGIRYSGNHYFFNLIGLCWILNSIKGNNYIDRIKRNTQKELEAALEIMIQSDGSLYENSTYYHKYVTESLLEFLLFNPANRSKKLMKCAFKMVRFCDSFSVNNKIIGFGDNDSGRLLPLPNYFTYDCRDLTNIKCIAAILDLNERKSKYSLKETLTSNRKSFGIRKINNSEWTLFLRCDEICDPKKNRVIGGHGHNDQLEILAYYQNEPIIVGTGTYLYVSNNCCRINNLKTCKHNTLFIEGKEQNTIFNDWRYIERRAKGSVIKETNNEIICSHNGYYPMIHERRVSLMKNRVIVYDKLDTKGLTLLDKVYLNFFFSEKAKIIESCNNAVTFMVMGCKYRLYSKNQVSIMKSEIHPEYGSRVDTFKVSIELTSMSSKVEIEKLQ